MVRLFDIQKKFYKELTCLLLLALLPQARLLVVNSQYGDSGYSGYSHIDYPEEGFNVKIPVSGDKGTLITADPIAGIESIEGVLLRDINGGNLTIELDDIESNVEPLPTGKMLNGYKISTDGMSIEDIQLAVAFKNKSKRSQDLEFVNTYAYTEKLINLEKETIFCACEDELVYKVHSLGNKFIFSIAQNLSRGALTRDLINTYHKSITLWIIATTLIWAIIRFFFRF